MMATSDKPTSPIAHGPATILRRLEQLTYFPAALPGESPSSWMCRAALSQGIGIREFTRFLGWTFTIQADQDVHFVRAFGLDLATVPQLDGLGAAANLVNALIASRTALGFHLLYRRGARSQVLPASRYCTKCLDSASTPVFALQWRFHDWRYCHEHDCLLEDACPNCGKRPRLPFSMIAEKGSNDSVESLTHCGHCRGPLIGVPPVTLEQALSVGFGRENLTLIERAQAQISEAFRTGRPCAGLPAMASSWTPGKFGTSLPKRKVIASAAEVRRKLDPRHGRFVEKPFPTAASVRS